MLLGTMVPSEELREEEKENELLEEVWNHSHPLSQTLGLCGSGVEYLKIWYQTSTICDVNMARRRGWQDKLSKEWEDNRPYLDLV